MLPAVPSILHCTLQCCPGWLLLSPNPANINNPSRPVARRIASMMSSTFDPSRAPNSTITRQSLIRRKNPPPRLPSPDRTTQSICVLTLALCERAGSRMDRYCIMKT
ncbi:unnamed protein product [Tuber melanosporum]|uniref:(Perigord truffle) hypothetical protein n=1 Tax=Tuber melanosporum (strain Mel28) TaxID=656061 RepID=D5GPM4_TUBMM|nr:uncharacterized protein GSTUM_00011924001 [Tuber melanosporum]CAZ86467.1 unnamed protein product [Tuber melanosporum]